MARKVIWTKRAIHKFNKIVDYLERDWGDNVTRNFVIKTYDIIELISDQSELGTLENQEKQIRGFVLTKHNRLFYRVTKEDIIILNFFDTRSDPKRKRD
ncbi:type II toxin-antitoxin system RelE/ParE family toxin [uncultured Roseivirga sp.]|uniref:type II toxin-antitoxin system RelE/ParE family toxin n=1 Tax=uncultured Roseivirga sp. TaxID=543088 RepID=UPI0030DDD81B|tara:strand:- start:141427 stop:141723 length:297 start_codon:yes stop_codon:yes gene_type:complete